MPKSKRLLAVYGREFVTPKSNAWMTMLSVILRRAHSARIQN